MSNSLTVNEEFDARAKKDPLAYGMLYIDLLQGRKWQLRPWQVEIYQALNPYYIEKNPIGQPKSMAIMKPTQVGISTAMAVKMFHFADYWPVRLMYMLPRQQDYIDFVTTRINPMISSSERLKELLGEPDSTRSKGLGNSFMFFMESTVEPRMMPADALYIDEVDLSEPAHMSTAINRLDDSNWQLIHYLSTPTLPNYGIHGRYELSDQRKWLVKCPSCNGHQELDWEKNVRVDGDYLDPDKVSYVCVHCGRELTVDDINENGQWVAEKPSKSTEMVGYHINQMMVHPASVLWTHWQDPEQTEVEFYRKRLGKPYQIGGGSLEREDFLITCFDSPYPVEMGHDGHSTYFMGLDQGNELQVVVGKVPQGKNTVEIVKIELIPMSEGFGRVAKLMRLFKVRRAVMDADPNRHSIRTLQNEFPGKVIMADYKEVSNRFETRKSDRGIEERVLIHRTEGFDDLMKSVRDAYWRLPGDPSSLPPDVELLINHVTGLRRDIEDRKLQSGVKQVGVWRKLRPDHLAHSMLYLKTAVEITKGRGHRIAVIGKDKGQNQQEEYIDETEELLADEGIKRPHQAVFIELAAIFAEVPNEQVVDYLINKTNPTYQIAFPLSHKLKVALDSYGEDDVYYVLNWITNNPGRVLQKNQYTERDLTIRR